MGSIKIDNLTKYFGKAIAINQINLDVANGELIALLGPSGCGKTTTLRLLAGFISPDAGQILVNGKVVSSKEKTIPPERRNMSMIFQSYAVWPHKTVYENVAFGLQVRRIGKEELRKRVEQALEITYLSRLANRYPAQLSGGQQQRVALARAIVISPEILLLDEPLSNLDASLREEMRSEIRRIHDEIGLTTVYVTHDQSEALVLADKIVVMCDGIIQQVGTPEEIYEKPNTEFVARFIGQSNVLPGILLALGQVDVGGVSIMAADCAPGISIGNEVYLLVRPHSIIIVMASLNNISVDFDYSINCFVAKVEYSQYFGSFREYKIRLSKMPHSSIEEDYTSATLSVVTLPNIRYQVGERIFLKIPPEHCRVLSRSTQVSH